MHQLRSTPQRRTNRDTIAVDAATANESRRNSIHRFRAISYETPQYPLFFKVGTHSAGVDSSLVRVTL